MMDYRSAFDFSGKRVLVIGASRGGIGAAIADGFSQCGARVSITGVEPEPIEVDRGRFAYASLDVADGAAVSAFADGFGGLDVLVNCAGMARRNDEYDPDMFGRVMAVNLHGYFHLANAFRDSLSASRGAIVAIASMYAQFGSPRVPAYGASKAGVAQLTRSLAIEFAPLGIRVNAISPGFIVTEQTAKSRADATHYQRVLDRTPSGRWGEPHDIVGPALFLASPAAAFVTGANLAADGGYTAV
ncbi:SDR family NAD(P)-dependent oxidoreductase [Bosea sp. PAMC 26642]|uniref:SDR family NAD(P)-dependent oxidoreductase n=1 Tax=Bosea sp. (strain PAMC 26642) TaxID=1792307 RepID=UPI000770003D|nr:SDR family oxidoreductase [Bosea sp. PAMC 26642]AMJ61518.1 2-deoxy-D-gluconate 3-dehydrogenase [Bosea sp. PAMC 26642]